MLYYNLLISIALISFMHLYEPKLIITKVIYLVNI